MRSTASFAVKSSERAKFAYTLSVLPPAVVTQRQRSEVLMRSFRGLSDRTGESVWLWKERLRSSKLAALYQAVPAEASTTVPCTVNSKLLAYIFPASAVKSAFRSSI